jgi:hypothetical protein
MGTALREADHAKRECDLNEGSGGGAVLLDVLGE